ncbi:MAG: hypothetical protein U0941_14185 [Planctomycetaceae bacterium]
MNHADPKSHDFGYALTEFDTKLRSSFVAELVRVRYLKEAHWSEVSRLRLRVD